MIVLECVYFLTNGSGNKCKIVCEPVLFLYIPGIIKLHGFMVGRPALARASAPFSHTAQTALFPPLLP